MPGAMAVRNHARLASKARVGGRAVRKAPALGRVVAARRPVAVRAGPIDEWSGEEYSLRQWGDPDFHEAVDEDFPEKGLADTEEGRVLKEEFDYVYLDIRSQHEVENEGVKIPGAEYIEFTHFNYVWDAEKGKKVMKKEYNENFVAEVQKRFPDKDTGILIACSGLPDMGELRMYLALEDLEAAGYTNIVGLRDGYVGWNIIFDNKQQRRRLGGFKSVMNHGGTTGIFDSGAGYGSVDPGPVTGFKGAFMPPTYMPGGIYYDEEDDEEYDDEEEYEEEAAPSSGGFVPQYDNKPAEQAFVPQYDNAPAAASSDDFWGAKDEPAATPSYEAPAASGGDFWGASDSGASDDFWGAKEDTSYAAPAYEAPAASDGDFWGASDSGASDDFWGAKEDTSYAAPSYEAPASTGGGFFDSAPVSTPSSYDTPSSGSDFWGASSEPASTGSGGYFDATPVTTPSSYDTPSSGSDFWGAPAPTPSYDTPSSGSDWSTDSSSGGGFFDSAPASNTYERADSQSPSWTTETVSTGGGFF